MAFRLFPRLLIARIVARFSRSNFRRQLSIVAALGIVGVALVSALAASWQGSRQTHETLLSQGLNLANSLARQSRLALLTGGAENAREAIEGTLAFPDVTRVELLLADGRMLLQRGAAVALPAAALRRNAREAYLEGETEQAWFFVAPVWTQAGEPDPFDMQAKPPELLGHVRVVQSKATMLRLVWRFALVNFGLGLAFAAISLWLLRALSQRLTRPLHGLADVMAQARRGERGLRARPGGPRDIAHMAQAFNEMMRALEQRERDLQQYNEALAQHAETLEAKVAERTIALQGANAELLETLESLRTAQAHLIESEKLASLGRLVAGVAHEINTPLGNAVTAASTLEESYQALQKVVASGAVRRGEFLALIERCQQGYSLVSRNLQRAAEVVKSFKQLSVDQSSEMRRAFDLGPLLHDVLGTMEPSIRRAEVRLQLEFADALAMDSYPGPLGQVVANIVTNALVHAFGEQALPELHIAATASGPEHVRLVFTDNGVGMNEAVRVRVFEAFFTTRFGQGGSGLGMQIVHNLVTGLLGGRIAVDSEPGQGSRFTIILPRVAPQPVEREEE